MESLTATKFLLLSLMTILSLAPDKSWAEVSLVPGQIPVIEIKGKISRGDYAALLSIAPPGKRLFVSLNSPGGDVDEAIQMGRLLRNRESIVNVLKGHSCVSACVLLLAGGSQRSVVGQVGIHRPYLGSDTSKTEMDQRKNYGMIERKIKIYLNEVNVSPALYDQMMRIPPDRVRYLTERELQDIGLNEDDPYYREALDSRIAESQGMTKSEWVAVQAICLKDGPSPNYPRCKDQVLKRERSASK